MSPDNSKPSGRTQRQRILDELLRSRDKGVPAPELAKIALQYNSRLKELRQLGFHIVCEVEAVRDGVKHTRFKLLTGPGAMPKVQEKSPAPANELLFSDGEMLSHDFDLEHLPD